MAGMSAESVSDSPLTFPCQFPIKAMGQKDDDFAALVRDIISRHAPDDDSTSLRARASSNGRYLAVTVTITATSRDQLDAIYHELSAHERVLVAL